MAGTSQTSRRGRCEAAIFYFFYDLFFLVRMIEWMGIFVKLDLSDHSLNFLNLIHDLLGVKLFAGVLLDVTDVYSRGLFGIFFLAANDTLGLIELADVD